MSKPLTEMTKAELKQYLSENRNDDDKFSEAMGVLFTKLPPQEKWNPPLKSLEDGKDIFQQSKNN